MNRFLSQLAVASLCIGVTVGLTVGPAHGSAPVSTDARAVARPVAEAASSRWMYGQLEDNRITNVQFDFDDWGLTIDTYLALVATGLRPRRNDQVIATVSDNASSYIQFGGDYFAGAVAKLLVARTVAGAGPYVASVNRNLRVQLNRMTAPNGRVSDTGQSDFSSTITQSLAVIALARSGHVPQPVVDFLLRQQCRAGFFRQELDLRRCAVAGSEPYVDSTAFAAQALLAARRDGAEVPRSAIGEVGDWLVSVQADNGSYDATAVGDTPNSNSTGLAGQALAALGRDRASAATAGWVDVLRITVRNADGGPAAADIGAIALNREALRLALADGVTDQTRDQFRRSTAQAQFALLPVPLGVLSAGG